MGLLLSAIHLYRGVGEFPHEFPAVVYGAALPLLVSIAITGAGYWTIRQDWAHVSPWRLAGWSIGGFIVGFTTIGLLLLYQEAEGVSLSDPAFTLLMFATYGMAGGLIFGQYDRLREQRKQKLSKPIERLEEFTSIVSHYLRNPLNVASGNLELARETVDSDHLDSVERALVRMEALIDDLLALARMDDSKTEKEYINLDQTVRTCWLNVASGDATLVVDTEGRIHASKSCLKQLLENLQGNAITHSGSDVTVTVGDLEDGFFVEDDGPGIPKDDRDNIFEAGYTTQDDGTGFGLNIVRRIIDDHGCEIAVTDSSYGGARFEITGVRRTE